MKKRRREGRRRDEETYTDRERKGRNSEGEKARKTENKD